MRRGFQQRTDRAKSVLTSKVLVVNSLYQAVDTLSVKKAFGAIVSGVARPMLMNEDGQAVPYTFDEWLKLPTEGENVDAVSTAKMRVRVPRIIQAVNLEQMPKRRQKFTRRAVWERDSYTCQYCGKKVTPGVDGNLDHVHPRSRNGKMSFGNMVVSCVDDNTKKGPRTPQEAGLKLRRFPKEPEKVPAMLLIDNEGGYPEWEPFLTRRRN